MIITGNFSEGKDACFEAPFAFMEIYGMEENASHLDRADQGIAG